MPSNRASMNPNMDGWQRVDTTPAPAPADTQANPLQRSALMHASMPLMASTADAFARQFYGAGNLPQYRTLPAKKASGA